MAPSDAIAEFCDWPSLIRALRVAKEMRDVSFEELDSLAGLADRYSSKVLGVNPARNPSGLALGLILQALGLKCLIVVDPASERRVLAAPRRDIPHVQAAAGRWRRSSPATDDGDSVMTIQCRAASAGESLSLAPNNLSAEIVR